MVVAGAVGCGAGATGLPLYSLGSFVAPLQAEFGWSRAVVAGAFLPSALGLAVGGLFIGNIIERWGARRVVLLSIPIFAAMLALLPAIVTTSVWSFWIACFFVTFLGIGTSPVAYARVLTTAFDRNLGLALGLTLAGTGVAAIVLPQLLSPVIAANGWRTGYLVLAAIALLPWPFAALMLPKSLERPSAQPHDKVRRPLFMPSWSHADETRRFLLMGAAFFLVSVGMLGVIIHLIPMLFDAGIDRDTAARTAAAVGYGVVGARIMIGWLVDRIHATVIATLIFLGASLGCLAIASGNPTMIFVGVIAIGFAVGAEVDLVAYLVSRYFAARQYARTYGRQFAIYALGAGLGPLAVSALTSGDGSYVGALYAASGMILSGAILLLMLGRPPPTRKDTPLARA